MEAGDKNKTSNLQNGVHILMYQGLPVKNIPACLMMPRYYDVAGGCLSDRAGDNTRTSLKVRFFCYLRLIAWLEGAKLIESYLHFWLNIIAMPHRGCFYTLFFTWFIKMRLTKK